MKQFYVFITLASCMSHVCMALQQTNFSKVRICFDRFTKTIAYMHPKKIGARYYAWYTVRPKSTVIGTLTGISALLWVSYYAYKTVRAKQLYVWGMQATAIKLRRKYYQQAAELGNVEAMCKLGALYETGAGGEKSYTQARYWYQRASDYGNKKAMGNLADLLQAGLGGEKDYARAQELYKKASRQG